MGSRPDSQNAALRNIDRTILLVGAGKMGSALVEGWLAIGLPPARVAVIEPQPSAALAALASQGLRLNPSQGSNREIAAVVIAVKPQVAAEAMPILAPFVGATTVVVSIMAGRTLRFLEASLPAAALGRAMPNTPAAAGRGITVAGSSAPVSGPERALRHA